MNYNELEPIYVAKHWKESGLECALATVINTWGSSPRPVGSQMVINLLGKFSGSVSGGCIETSVVSEAIEVIKSKKTKMLEFNVTNKDAWGVGLTCGGRVNIYLEPIE